MAEEMERDERVVLLGQDVAEHGGSYGETQGLFERFGAARVRNTPVAEGATVGIAAGAAAAGLRPLAFITYSDFLMPALDPLVNYAAKLRFQSAGDLRAPLVVKTTAGAKGQGPTHAQALEPWLMSVPGLTVVSPSTASDAYGLLKTALRFDGPVVFIDHKRLFPLGGDVPDHEFLVPFGVAAIRREGRHATIIAFSWMCIAALEAAAALAKEGIDVEVVDLRSLWPVDWAALIESVGRTGHALLVEEGQVVCGVGAELAFRLHEAIPGVRLARLGAVRAPVAASPPLESYVIPDARKISTAVRSLLGKVPSGKEGTA
jgi:pyruvate dehydrogenase E1 component beta subunit